MDAKTAYVSSIPPEATPKQTGRYDNRRPTRIEYYLGKELVGNCHFTRDGVLGFENSWRNGKRHGWVYYWRDDGTLVSADPYENGVEHGTAYQWAPDGSLMGTYTMVHGTGIDLWWNLTEDGIALTEAYQMVDGLRHGCEWGFSYGIPEILDLEVQYVLGEKHGIERHWDLEGRLKDGYPQFWIHRVQVNRNDYRMAVATDQTLRPYREEEDAATREFPGEVNNAFWRNRF